MQSEWPAQEVELSKCCLSIEDGDWIETKDQGDGGYRLLQISNIGLGEFRETSNYRWVTPETFARLRCNAIRVGDVLVARMPEPTGRCWYVDKLPWPAVTAVDVAIVRTDPKLLDPLYCSYFLNSPETLAAVAALTVGTTRTRIKRSDLGSLKLRLPPLTEQKRITATLRSLDDRIDLLRQTNATLESIAQALFKSWFIDFDPVRAKAEGREPEGMDAATAALFPSEFEESELGLIPKGWTASSLGALCKAAGGWIQTGPFGSQLHASDYLDAGIPVVMPQDMKGRRVSEDRIARISQANADRLSKHKLEIGDIVFSRRGDVGRHATVSEREEGWLCGTGCLLVRPGPQTQSPAFLSQALAYPVSVEWLLRHAVGATMPNLNTGILEALPLLNPAPRVLERFEELVGPFERRITLNDAHVKTLGKVRDAVLPRLIAGTLTVPISEVHAETTPA